MKCPLLYEVKEQNEFLPCFEVKCCVVSAKHCQLYLFSPRIGIASGTGTFFLLSRFEEENRLQNNWLSILIPIYVCKINCIDTVRKWKITLGVQFLQKYKRNLLTTYKDPTYCRKAYSKVAKFFVKCVDCC
jgi:hypothetical protein